MSTWGQPWGTATPTVWGQPASADTGIVSASVADKGSPEILLRQGVSMLVCRHRYQDIQPKFWVGDDDHYNVGRRVKHEHKQLTFGVEDQWAGFSSFDDRRFDIDIYRMIDHFVSGVQQSVTDAFVSAGDDDGAIELLNGVFEPLAVRTSIPGFTPHDNSHVIRAEYAMSSRGDPIEQYVVTDEIQVPEPYVEIGVSTILPTTSYVATGLLSGSTVYKAEVLSLYASATYDVEQRDTPFIDSDSVTSYLAKSTITPEREHFLSALQQLSGSTDVFSLSSKRSTAAGSVYHSTPFGTDSIAYGGLLRYKVTS